MFLLRIERLQIVSIYQTQTRFYRRPPDDVRMTLSLCHAGAVGLDATDENSANDLH